MENLQASEKKPTINLNKAPRSFENGVVGLGIVAAMTDLSKSKTREPIFSTNSPRSRPIPIVDLRGAERENSEVDESSESYTCVISHIGNKLVKKCVYFDENKLENCSVFFASSSPMNIGDEVKEDIWSEDFLSSCTLCNKQLQGLDIFMYRGEKAFCSTECRDKQIRSDNHHQKKCRSEARKRLDYSASPSSGSPLICAGVAVA